MDTLNITLEWASVLSSFRSSQPVDVDIFQNPGKRCFHLRSIKAGSKMKMVGNLILSWVLYLKMSRSLILTGILVVLFGMLAWGQQPQSRERFRRPQVPQNPADFSP